VQTHVILLQTHVVLLSYGTSLHLEPVMGHWTFERGT
jgi:hypothetical protein